MLLCHSHSHCDLDLYPIDLKIDREHLLCLNSVCMKFEKAAPNETRVIDLTRLYKTDRWCKAIYPIFFKWGHKYHTFA